MKILLDVLFLAVSAAADQEGRPQPYEASVTQQEFDQAIREGRD